MRKLSRCHYRWVSNIDAVMDFVFFLQATQNSNGGFYARLIDDDFLKAPLKRGIFFYVFTILI